MNIYYTFRIDVVTKAPNANCNIKLFYLQHFLLCLSMYSSEMNYAFEYRKKTLKMIESVLSITAILLSAASQMKNHLILNRLYKNRRTCLLPYPQCVGVCWNEGLTVKSGKVVLIQNGLLLSHI